MLLPRYVTTRECSDGERRGVVKKSCSKLVISGSGMIVKGTGEPPSMPYVAKGSVFAVPLGTVPYQLREVPVTRRDIVQIRTRKMV